MADVEGDILLNPDQVDLVVMVVVDQVSLHQVLNLIILAVRDIKVSGLVDLGCLDKEILVVAVL